MADDFGKLLVGLFAVGSGFYILTRSRTAEASAGVSPNSIVPPPSNQAASKYLPTIVTAVSRHPEFATAAVRYRFANKEAPVVGLLYTESRFKPDAVSPTGADGIAQFTSIARAEVRRLMTLSKWRVRYTSVPGIANRLSAFDETLAYVPDVAIEACALLLASLLAKWNGDLEAALTDYNAGGNAARIVHDAGSQYAVKSRLVGMSQASTYSPEVIASARTYQSGNMAVAGFVTRRAA